MIINSYTEFQVEGFSKPPSDNQKVENGHQKWNLCAILGVRLLPSTTLVFVTSNMAGIWLGIVLKVRETSQDKRGGRGCRVVLLI